MPGEQTMSEREEMKESKEKSKLDRRIEQLIRWGNSGKRTRNQFKSNLSYRRIQNLKTNPDLHFPQHNFRVVKKVQSTTHRLAYSGSTQPKIPVLEELLAHSNTHRPLASFRNLSKPYLSHSFKQSSSPPARVAKVYEEYLSQGKPDSAEIPKRVKNNFLMYRIKH